MEGDATSKRYKRERAHHEDFWKWLQEQVSKRDVVSSELQVLALGPNRTARRFSGYVINGYRFHTKSRDSRCTTQNSGIFLTAKTTSFASSKDQNPIIGDVNYYGSIEDIIEIDYWGVLNVVLFKCCWYQEERDPYGMTRVNFKKLSHKSDPYVIASQVQQVFYVEDPVENAVHYAIKNLPRDWCDTEDKDCSEEEYNHSTPDKPHINLGCEIENQVGEFSWFRDDVPKRQIPKSPTKVKKTPV